jgi:hypothetical protein
LKPDAQAKETLHLGGDVKKSQAQISKQAFAKVTISFACASGFKENTEDSIQVHFFQCR